MALLVATTLRLLFVCLSSPVIAYGNSYDFVRQSSCVGVWEDYGGLDKTRGNPQRPVNSLVYDGDRRSRICLPSSDNLFPWLASRLHNKRSSMQLREVGFVKALIAIVLLAFVLLQPVSARLRLALSVAVTLVFGDVALLCYWNTLYLEVSVIVFAFVGTALAVVNYGRLRPPGLLYLVGLCGVLVWLGFARQQYSPFVGVIGAVSAVTYYLKWQKRGSAVAIVAFAACVIGGFQFFHGFESEHTRQVEKANLTDTFLGAVLPVATDRLAAIRVAGLPDTCLGAVGSDWYSPGFQSNNPCPAVYDLGRVQLLKLFAYDPRLLVLPIARAIRESRPLLLSYFGHYERPDEGEPQSLKFLVATSFSTVTANLPANWYFGLVAFGAAIAPLCCVLAVMTLSNRRAGRADLGAGLTMIALGGCLIAFAVVSSVFGDGYFEMPRHALGVDIGMAFQVAGLLPIGAFLTHVPWKARQGASNARSDKLGAD